MARASGAGQAKSYPLKIVDNDAPPKARPARRRCGGHYVTSHRSP